MLLKSPTSEEIERSTPPYNRVYKSLNAIRILLFLAAKSLIETVD